MLFFSKYYFEWNEICGRDSLTSLLMVTSCVARDTVDSGGTLASLSVTLLESPTGHMHFM